MAGSSDYCSEHIGPLTQIQKYSQTLLARLDTCTVPVFGVSHLQVVVTTVGVVFQAEDSELELDAAAQRRRHRPHAVAAVRVAAREAGGVNGAVLGRQVSAALCQQGGTAAR